MRRCLFALICLALVPTTAFAGLGPENVAVVVNADSAASLSVANAFVARWRIPRGNLIYLDQVPGYEHVGVDEFREKLLKPVLKEIAERGLTPQIECVAWSADFPYAVDVQADVSAAGLKLPQVLTPTAALNGLTYLYEPVLEKDPRYLDLNANRYYRRASRRGTSPDGATPKPVTNEEVTKFREAMKLVTEKKWDAAAPLLAELAKARPGESQLQYNLACALAQLGKNDEALVALTAAVEAGWYDRAHTEKDDDLKSLRDRDDYRALLAKMTPPLFDVQPTLGFRASDRWNDAGERVDEGGRRHLLSVVLALTSGRGTSLDDALRLYDAPRVVGTTGDAAGDASGPGKPAALRDGTVYFLKNGDVRARTREWAFASAAEQLKKLGLKAEVIDGAIPQGKRDVAGAVVGIADFDWAASGSAILPGAIVEHLTSFGGVIREHSGQTPLTKFLKHGAAGASGTVTEPYAIQAKFPTAFLHVHYARGATLAEAFYQSVQGPYQLLIVGDPLMQPFARPTRFTLKGLKPGETASGKVELSATAPSDDPPPERFEFFLDGVRVGQWPTKESFTLDADALPAGYHALTVQSVGGPLETRGSLAQPVGFFVGPPDRRVTLVVEGVAAAVGDLPAQIGSDRIARVRVTSPAAAKVTVRIQGRPAAEFTGTGAVADGAEGNAIAETTVGIPLHGFGEGVVEVDAVAETSTGQVRSAPLSLRIVGFGTESEPAADLASAALEEGLLLRIGGREPIVVADTRDPNWLAAHQLAPGAAFTLEGVFDMPAGARHAQFQSTGNCSEVIQLDGRRLSSTRDGQRATGAWSFWPCQPAPGRHRARIAGRAPTEPNVPARLVVRYGHEGSQSLDGKRFRHVPAEKAPR